MNKLTIRYRDLNRIMKDYKSTLKSTDSKNKPVLQNIKCVTSGVILLTSCTDGFRVIQDRTNLIDSNVDNEFTFLLPYIDLVKSPKYTIIELEIDTLDNETTIKMNYDTGVKTVHIVKDLGYPDLDRITEPLNNVNNQTYVGSFTPKYLIEALKSFDKKAVVDMHSRNNREFFLTSLEDENHKCLLLGAAKRYSK